MPTYSCNEKEFLENLRKYLDNGYNPEIHRCITSGYRYIFALSPTERRSIGLNKIIDGTRLECDVRVDGKFFKKKTRIWQKGFKFTVARFPYYNVEYSFTVLENTYKHSFRVYHKLKLTKIMELKTEKRTHHLFFAKNKKVLSPTYEVQVLEPDKELLHIPIPEHLTVMEGKMVS